jgi:uncharacterized protein (TIGR00288 family)
MKPAALQQRRENMNSENRVAIFVDAENVTQWIKQDGLETLLEELSSIGTVVVRKAYARWTNTNLAAHQSTLNRLGFELIHTFHPVSGKNSADIQLAVDVMEYAGREDLQSIALATGDSDFSPLFRRLREMGKHVLGAGPRSALSESVKSSCSRFFYTDAKLGDENQDEATRASAFDDAADVLETALKTFDGPANCSALKNRMLNIDSAFDEKNLGFKSFTDFVRAVDGVGLNHDDKTWSAFREDSESLTTVTAKATVGVATSDKIEASEQYRRILRKMQWRAVPVSVITRCFTAMQSFGTLPRSEILEKTVIFCDGQVTTADIRKAASLLMKAGLFLAPDANEDGESPWKVTPVADEDMLWAIDRAMAVRLLAGIQKAGLKLDEKSLQPLLLSEQAKKDVGKLLTEAKNTGAGT